MFSCATLPFLVCSPCALVARLMRPGFCLLFRCFVVQHSTCHGGPLQPCVLPQIRAEPPQLVGQWRLGQHGAGASAQSASVCICVGVGVGVGAGVGASVVFVVVMVSDLSLPCELTRSRPWRAFYVTDRPASAQIWDLRAGHSVRSIFGPYIAGDAVDVHQDVILTGSCRTESVLQVRESSHWCACAGLSQGCVLVSHVACDGADRLRMRVELTHHTCFVWFACFSSCGCTCVCPDLGPWLRLLDR